MMTQQLNIEYDLWTSTRMGRAMSEDTIANYDDNYVWTFIFKDNHTSISFLSFHSKYDKPRHSPWRLNIKNS